MRTILSILFSLSILLSFSQKSAHFGAAKYVPEGGKKLLILGQDLGSVGGLSAYTNGYIDNVGHIPAGVTTYTDIPNLGGLERIANWGAGDINGQAYVNDPSFDNACIAIGLFINGRLNGISSGFLNGSIRNLANWIKATERPVFLRIGYEFDGPWNDLIPSQYKEAWIHIVKIFDEEDVRNVAYVWQSAGINTPNIDRWYPGDEYVNWVAYSHFDGPNPGQSIRDFAAEHDKPIMIAEATPRGRDLSTGVGETEWDRWFDPLFRTIDSNTNIKALAYINANWEAQSMWQGEGWGDTRVETNSFITDQWLSEINDGTWLLSSDNLLTELQYTFWQETTILSANKEIENRFDLFIDESTFSFVSTDRNLLFEVAIYDLKGRKILEQPSRGGMVEVNKSGISENMLIARIYLGKKIITRKILVRN